MKTLCLNISGTNGPNFIKFTGLNKQAIQSLNMDFLSNLKFFYKCNDIKF